MNANPLSRNVRKFGKQVLRHLTGPVLRVTAAVVMVASSLPLSVLLPPVPAGALVTPALAATAVTPGNVVVNPTTAGAIAAYTVNFTTSGALTTSDTITLTFPAGTLLPNTAGLSGAATNATVNGANAAASGVVNGQAITLTAPAAIGNSIAVAVVFTAAAGIINPTSAGSKTIGIATSQDTTQVASNSYTITPGPSVTPGSVVVNPAQAGLIGAYTINFTTSATGALALGNAITLTFPAGTLLPNTAGLSGAATNATINGANAADSGSVSGQSITLNAPAAIGNSTAVAVVFTTNAGIINPTSAGGYTINVSTFKDITPVASNSYTITPGTAVTPGNVTVSPNTTGVIGVYTVNFTTSATGALTGGNYIKLTFPAGTLLPNTPGLSSDPTHATVNGANVATSATVSGQTITLLAPGAIGNSTAVTVVFTTAAGIINPSAGSYTVSILTFKDLAPTASNSYTIQARPSVAVNPTTAGAAAAYTVNFTTSPTGALTATSDTITLTFPANTGLPTQGALSGDPANATINGVNAAASAVISGQSITLTVPAAIANSGSVTVVFPASAGIHNPSAGSKTLTVVTTKDTAAVQSDPYTITAVATSVSGVTAAPNPTTAGAAAAYTINFTTSATGGLAAGDTISLTFPAGTGLPGQAALQGAPATVTINGGNAGGTATVAGQVITLTAPSAIANSGSVTISFTLAAGLHNPATAGNYAVLVATSKDTTGVASPAYAIVAAATAVTGGTVVLSPNRAGNAADHVISFTTSASGGLTGGADSVTITFPAGTTVPASIPAQNVRFDGDGTCNVIGNHAFTDGTVLGGVTVSGQQISFTVPTGETVPASGGACVGILGAGGILNPTTSGTYLLTMSTSKDTDTANSQAYAVLQAAGCGTTVGGVINADTTWTVAGSPFCVTSSITVNNGKTLTIEPGTEVQMGGSTLLAVDGALIARGTSALPIKFTSSAISPSAGTWNGLQFTANAAPTQFDGTGGYLSGSVLQWVTIEYAGGSPTPGAIELQQIVGIDHSTIRQSATRGLYAPDGLNNLRITNNTFDHNATACCTSGGAIHAWGDNLIITGNTFSNNSTTYEGGAIRVRNNATISGNTFTANSVSSSVGGAVRASGSATVTNNTFTGNWSGVNAGALYVDGSSTITGNTFTSNASASWAGAIWAGGSATINNNTFTSNTSYYGGAIWAETGATLTGNTFTSNSAHWGGALFIERAMTVSRNLFVDNRATSGDAGDRRGAAVFARYGYAVTLQSNTFSKNRVVLSPGETSASAALHIQDGMHPSATGNTFAANAPYDLSDWNGCCGTYDFSGNYWSTTSDAGVVARIYHFFNDASLERVIYRTFATAPDANAPRPAATVLTASAGDGQIGPANTALPQPFVVEARDVSGGPLASLDITFAIVGTPTGAVNQDIDQPASGVQGTFATTTDVNGRAQATFTLGSRPGIYTVTASAPNAASASTALFAATATVSGCTTVGGSMTQNTTWTLDASPYCVSSSVVVSGGITLTVQPGVEVRFATNTRLQVDGALIAQGTSAAPIKFTSSSPSPAAGSWLQILYSNSATPSQLDAQGNYLGGSVLQYATVEYATAALEMHQPVLVDHVAFHQNNGRAITTTDSLNNLRITNSTFDHNSTVCCNSGGAIHAWGDNHIITGNTFSNNSTTYEGGAIRVRSNATISGNTFTANSVSSSIGGAVRASGSATVTNNTFTGNWSGSQGGALYVEGSSTITGNTFTSNSSATWAGAIWAAGGSVTISNNTFTSNSSANGGAIWAEGGSTLTANTFTSNSAHWGGALYVERSITVTGNLFVDNRVGSGDPGDRRGAAVFSRYGYNLVLRQNTFSSNRVNLGASETSVSGAVHVQEGSQPTLKGNSFLANAPYDLSDWNACCGTLDATGNYWGTGADGGVLARVYDFYNDGGLERVIYRTFLTAADSNAPAPAPKMVSVASGDGQAGATASVLPQPFVVQVRDTNGPVNGASVTFTVTQNPIGAVNQDVDQVTTGVQNAITVTADANGRAQTTLTLGSRAGLYITTATVTGASATDASAALFTTIATPSTCTAVGGPIDQNLTLAAGTTYCATSSIAVAPGVVFTMEAGSELRFDPAKAMYLDGALVARGTAAAPIKLTSSNGAAARAAGDWKGIVFSNLASPTDLTDAGAYLSGSILQYVTLEYSGGYGGGAVQLGQPVMIDNAIMRLNASRAVWAPDGLNALRITNSTFDHNATACCTSGGAIHAWGDNHVITGNTFSNNSTTYEGGAMRVRSNATISGNTFTANSVSSSIGGAVRTSGGATVTNNTFTGNWSGSQGGALYVDGSSTVTGNTFTSNSSATWAGAIWAAGGSVTISNNTFTSNSSANGGAIWAEGGSTISGNTFTSNSAHWGGALYVERSITIRRNKFVTNQVTGGDDGDRRGAAVFGRYGYSVTLEENLFAANRVVLSNNEGSSSGAVHVQEGMHPTIRGNTFAANVPYDLTDWNACCGTLDATSNHWGTTGDGGILARIYDFFDDGGLERVVYRPFLPAAAPNAPTAGLPVVATGGDGQTGPAGSTLPQPFVASGLTPNIQVTFDITMAPTGAVNQDIDQSAGGQQSTFSTTADGTGHAQATLTLGSSPGLYVVKISVPSDPATGTVFTATATPSGCTAVGGPIDQSLTLTAAGPYCVTSSFAVATGVSLTLQPGAELRFNPAKALYVDGALVANGTAANPILLTSGSATSARSAGDWRGVYFSSLSSPTDATEAGVYQGGSILRYTTIEFGGQGAWNAVSLNQPVLVDHTTIRQTSGRGLWAADDLNRLHVTDSTFDHNATPCCTSGGAIHAWGDNHVIKGNTFTNNTTTYEGGAIRVRSNATISGNTFTANSDSSSIGGAVRAAGGALVTNNTFTGNWSGNNGGALYTDGSSTITGNTFTSNASANWGGAIWAAGGSSTISNNTFTSNSSANGGAIWAEGGTSIADNGFISNSAHWGGALYVERSVSIVRNLFKTNHAVGGTDTDRRGAAVFSRYNYSVTLRYNTFTANAISLNPGETSTSGALHIQEGSHPTISGNTFGGDNTPYGLSDWNGCCGTEVATGNFWATTVEGQIQGQIYDHLDNGGLETVQYTPWLDAPDPNAVLTINGAESEVTVAPLSALATGADQVTITVTVKDASGVTVPGATVVVNASGSNNTLTAVVDQGNGTYTALLSSTKAEVKVISATANGAPIAQTATATFVAGAPTRYAVTSTLTAPPPGTMVTLYAQLMDANNNNAGEAGHVVTWTTSTGALSAASSTTDASGRAAVQLTTSVAPGVAHTVTALEVANGLTGAITLTNINSVATRYIVTSSSATPPAGSAVTLSAQLADAAGQPAAEAGRIVNWSSTNGGAFLNLTSVTNASGVATMQFTVSTTPSTVHTVTATDGQGLTGSTAVTATGGGNPTITVRDGAGNALVTVYAGSPVRVVGNNFAPGGSGKVQLNGIALGTGCDPAGVFLANFANATSSFDALVTVPLACSGNVTVLAVNGTQVIASASLTVLTPFVSPGRSSMAASRTAAPADGVTTVTMTVTVRDSNNNLLAGRPVSLTYIRGANASANDGIVPPASNSDSGGTAVFTITSSTLGVANFTATADGVHLGQSIAVTFTGPGASITMVAQSLPQMAGSFNFGFTPSGGSTTSFTLDDNPASALANSRGFNDLPLGAYTVRQLPAPAGWLLTNVVCTGATGSSVLVTGASDTAGFQPGDDRALITLVAGDHITCTFTNTRLASITIVADSDPDSPQAFTFTLVKPSGQGDLYVLDDDATTDTHPRQTTVAALSPGAYTLTEAPVPGWSLTATNCPTASMTSVPNGVTLQMAAGQDVTCTFTNSQSPQVTLSLNPAQIVTGVNSTVNVTIHMDSGGQLVDGAQAVLNFDPAILEVVDNGGALATEVALGDCALPTLILNAVDNAHGAINLALGADQTTPTPISGACNLGVVRFHTKAGTTGNGSSIGLALGPAFPASGASFATTNLVVTATGASVVTQDKGLTFVQVPAQVAHSFPFGKAVTVRLMDGDQPNTSDNTTVVTLRIGTGPAAAALTCAGDANVSDPGDEQPGTPGVQKTAVNGLVTFRNCAIDLPGDYTVQATATGAATATTTLHVTWTGDANGDCSVSIIDFSILVTSFNKTTGTAGFVQAADFDGSGKVDILDFSKLVTMFATRCPSLTANAGTPASGGQTEFQLTGSSYKAFATLAITVDGAASAVVATADGTGAWTAAVTVPTGMHVIKASQLNGRVIAGVVVTAPAAP